MKMRMSFFVLSLLAAHICCWGETNSAPAREYTMVDVGNGLTCKLLEIGTTSFTFSVEWPLDMKFETGTLDLFGKLDVRGGWNPLHEIALHPTKREGDDGRYSRFPVEFDQDQRKATFEIQYNRLLWYIWEREDFEKQAFFHVAIPDPNDMGWDGTWPEKEEQSNVVAKDGAEPAPPPRRRWLYLAVPFLAICAVLYFMRKKQP